VREAPVQYWYNVTRGCVETDETRSAHGPSARVRPAHHRRARHPVRAAVVHRCRRHPQVGRRSRLPSSRAPSPRASASTARPSRASPGCTRPTCSPSPTPRPSRCCRGAVSDPGTARMFCDISPPTGSRAFADPRTCSSARWRKAADRGFTFYTHPEIEFYLLHQTKLASGSSRSGRRRPATSTTCPHGTAHDFRRRRSRCSRAWASRSSSATTRAGPGQNEIDLRYADALSTADNIMTFRTVSRRWRSSRASRRRSCPSRCPEHPGSGMHTHLSAVRGRHQRLPRGRRALPAVQDGRQFIAGLLRHARRDHGRHQPVGQLLQAPVGRRRGAGIPHLGPQQPVRAHPRAACTSPTRATRPASRYRSIDSACNPYLAFAVLLAAGLKGIEEGYELPPEAEDDVWSLTDAERRAMGIEPLPSALGRAWSSWSAPSSSPRPSASTSSTTSCATSAPSGGSIASRSPSSSWTATSPGCRSGERSPSWSIGRPVLSRCWLASGSPNPSGRPGCCAILRCCACSLRVSSRTRPSR
jgi:hypothetical protein